MKNAFLIQLSTDNNLFEKIEKIVNFLHTPIVYFQFGSRPSCPSYTFLNCLQTKSKTKPWTDHSACLSMKSMASHENWCKLQDSVNINTSNAPCCLEITCLGGPVWSRGGKLHVFSLDSREAFHRLLHLFLLPFSSGGNRNIAWWFY